MLNNKFYSFLSPAKLNLGLKITGKRNDGYHYIHTIFCLINLFDEIKIQVLDHSDKISIIEHQQAWHYTDDLSYKAAQSLQQYAKVIKGVNIKIKKTIPSGAGLGGGSSNAATILTVLNRLWQCDLSFDELKLLAIKLGADIPFFLYGKNAIAKGIGEILSPIKITKQYFVLIKPSFGIPTKTIFNNIDKKILSNPDITTSELLSSKKNDLFDIAIKIYPQLLNIKNYLSQYGNVNMSGSGSTLFLTYTNKIEALNVHKQLKKIYNVFFVESIDQSPIC
jgi:4-diphosphocytidyl-2-C-methyl-D-erythritol kinase